MDKTQEDLIKSITAIVAPMVFFGIIEYKANKKVTPDKAKRNELRALRREFYRWSMYDAPKLTTRARLQKRNEMINYINFVANH